jgi:uncharacterized glyoxalase superfamily protein PhnB
MEQTPMHFSAVIPNLVAADMARAVAFYRDVLGFDLVRSVPDEAPFVFAWLQRGGATVFFNDRKAVEHDLPGLVAGPIGGTFTLYVTMTGVDALYASVKDRVAVVMPIVTQPYGMREFAIRDSEGYVVMFAEEVAAGK